MAGSDRKPSWLVQVESELLNLERPYVCIVLDGTRAMQLGNMRRLDQIDLLMHVVKGLVGEELAGLPDPGKAIG